MSQYRFRLRLASKQGGKFAFNQAEVDVPISTSLTLELAARNADSLDKATNYHIDGAGFDSEKDARAAAEALRVRLRLLNAVLNLGLNIPSNDEKSGFVSPEFKAAVRATVDGNVVDNIWGVNVFPDDGKHFEYIMACNMEVRPSDPEYIFEGLRTLWALEISLDSSSETALHILGLSTQETTDKAAFLAAYLALEQLIERKQRSTVARAQISRFQQELSAARADEPGGLSAKEVESLTGALGALTEESFSSALTRFAKSIITPDKIEGLTPSKFFSACIGARNKIAHQAEPNAQTSLASLTAGLRAAVLGLIWQRNNLPPFSMNTPPSSVSIPTGGLQFRVM